MNAQIENNFSYHAPSENDVVKLKNIRDFAKAMAHKIDTYCPDSREKSVAMTKLEEAVMWANAAIVRNK